MLKNNESIFIVLLMITMITLMIIANIGMEKQEKVECLQWQEQAKELDGYWITKWQSDQCSNQGIIINAPVK